MRMEPAGRPKKWNTFQQRLGRLRPDFNVISWHATRNDLLANIPTANVLAKLKPWHYEMNTTRGLTPGLLIPELGEDGGRVPLPDFEEGRGFGRQFSKRQGTNAGGSQPQRKRTRRPRPQGQAQPEQSSRGSDENDSVDFTSSSEEEQPRATKRVARASESPVWTPISHQMSATHDSAGGGVQNTQQAFVNSQLPMGIAPNQYRQFTPVLPSSHLSPYLPGTVASPGGGTPLRQMNTFQLLGRSSSDSTNVIQFSGHGHTERRPPYHPFTRMDTRNTQYNRPPLGPHLSTGAPLIHRGVAPFPPLLSAGPPAPQHVLVPHLPAGAPGIRRGIAPLAPILSARPPPAQHVLAPHLPAGVPVAQHGFAPFVPLLSTRAPATQHVVAAAPSPHVPAAPPAVPPTTQEQRLRNFRLPGPSPYFPQFPSEDGMDGYVNLEAYVDPFLERFFKQYLPSVPSGYLDPVHQTRLTLV